jgi:hypothetical protein
LADNATGIKAALIRLTKLDAKGNPLPEEDLYCNATNLRSVLERGEEYEAD